MLNRLIALLVFVSGSAFGQAAALEPESAPVQIATGDPGDTILVVGQRPGPGLWKVSKGDHVLWVFGTYSPLPIKMTWRSHEVEAILARSQEFISPPSANLDIGKMRMLTLLPFAFGVNKLPDGKTLRDVLPADVYARWLPFKEKYFGSDDDVERLRPLMVADRLYWSAMKDAGLGNVGPVRDKINQLVKQYKVKVSSPDIKLAVDSPHRLLKQFKGSTLDDVECFIKTLDRLDHDLEALRARANAWAKGDLDAIDRLSFADREGACAAALTDSAVLKTQAGFQNIDARLKETWMETVEMALANNKSTFAVLPMRLIVDPKGYLAALAEKGYVVERPE